MSSFKRLAWILATAVAFLVFVQPSPAAAEPMLSIQFSGLNLTYITGALCDGTTCSSGSGIRAESDPLLTMSFDIDLDGDSVFDVHVGTLVADIWADIVLDLSGIPVGGGTVSGGSGFFDLLTKDSDPGWGIALNISDFEVTYSILSSKLFFFGAGVTSDIFFQDLPFGLVAGTPVTFSFSSQIAPGTLTDDGTFLTGFKSSGTGEIQAPVPEPGTVGLLGLALVALGIRRRT